MLRVLNAPSAKCPTLTTIPIIPTSPISPVSRVAKMNRAMRARAVGVAWTANVGPQPRIAPTPWISTSFFLEPEAAHVSPVNWGAWFLIIRPQLTMQVFAIRHVHGNQRRQALRFATLKGYVQNGATPYTTHREMPRRLTIVMCSPNWTRVSPRRNKRLQTHLILQIAIIRRPNPIASPIAWRIMRRFMLNSCDACGRI